MKPRITITRRHTGRFYVGLDQDSFVCLLAIVRHAELQRVGLGWCEQPEQLLARESTKRLYKTFSAYVERLKTSKS